MGFHFQLFYLIQKQWKTRQGQYTENNEVVNFNVSDLAAYTPNATGVKKPQSVSMKSSDRCGDQFWWS